MLLNNEVKKKLKEGKVAIGTFVRFADPASVELLAVSGMEFFMIDNEHFTFNDETIQNMVRAANIWGIVPIIRTINHSPEHITRVLDCGALGILVPHVDTYEEALKIANAAKYYPLGTRGFCNIQRPAEYGTIGLDEYVKQANENVLVISYCEDKKSVENLDEILKIPTIDVIFIGPFDLAQSYGEVGNPGAPIVQDAINTIISKTRAANKAVGTIAPNVEAAKKLIEKGVQYIALSSDHKMVFESAKKMLAELKD